MWDQVWQQMWYERYKFKQIQKVAVILGVNGVAMDRHGLILWENEATGSRKVFRCLRDLRDTIFELKMAGRTPKFSEKSTEENKYRRRGPKTSKMEAQRVQTSTENYKKRPPETTSEKDTGKYRQIISWDHWFQGFRFRGVTQIRKFEGLQKVAKTSPKYPPKGV